MSWVQAGAVSDLERAPVLLREGRRQIAVFLAGGGVYAVDNRCPHEGYPLVEGTVDADCQLTCNWHNWKFRLSDGKCVLGGDNVRAYPAKVEAGAVWVDVADPPAEVIESAVLEGLRIAFHERDFARICREISRLHYNRLDPSVAVRKGIEWSHDRFEFGTTHAYAAAADWMSLSAEFSDDWEKRLICLAETVDHMAFDALRHKAYPYAPAGEEFDGVSFADAVEAEDTARAEAMVARGLADGLHWREMEQAFAAASLRHYNDFGHSLIYVYKTGPLVQLAGQEMERSLLPALARSLCYATREDLIPEFKDYAGTLAELEMTDHAAEDCPTSVPYLCSTKEAFAWMAESYPQCGKMKLYDALLQALARNLLHYDMKYQSAYDKPVSQNVGWLDFTHGVTFANAVRAVCVKFPELWPQGLLQMACFVGRNRRYLDLDLNEDEWLVDNRDAFAAAARETILDHGMRDPIFSAHLLKTTLAVEEEWEFASADSQTYLLAGLNRFLHSPIKQKHVRRLARQAIALVRRDFE